MAGGINDKGARRFSRIPPESTGDRMYSIHTAEIEYSGKAALDTARGSVYNWKVGARYDIGGGFGNVHVHGVKEYDSDSGLLAVHYNSDRKYDAPNASTAHPAAASSISIGGDSIASVVDAYSVYIQANNIMGYDNPEYGLDVDITGSAKIRFAEGLPQLDAWGKLRVSGGTQLADYVFGQEVNFTQNFSPVKLSGGYATYSNTRHAIQVGVDHTVDPTNGFASASSNQYHHYIAGSSHLYAGTALLNSPVTTGNTRRWGLFDANNGFFFQLGTGGVNAVDNTGFSVVVRSNIPSAPQKDTIIPRADWNGDKLDGRGDSQETIDLSKINIWWIDIQWHGAGRVRFGTYIDGARVVCHSYYQGNEYAQAMSQTTSLPCCFSNKSTAASATNLYIESWSAAVWTESDIDLRAFGSSASYASPHTAVTANISDDWQFLFALSPRELHANGEVNHSLYVPTSIKAYAFNDTGLVANQFDAADAIIDLKMEINSIHDAHLFTPIPSTEVEVSTTGTSYQAGKIILQDMFKGRYDNTLTDTFNNFQYGSVKNFPDDGGTVANNVVTISAASPAVVQVGERLAARQPMETTFPFNTAGGKYTISGTDNASYNGTSFFVKPTSPSTAELYEAYDPVTATYSSPIDGVALGSATGGSLTGFQGSRVVWSFFAKTRTAYYPDAKMMVVVNWKEIVQ